VLDYIIKSFNLHSLTGDLQLHTAGVIGELSCFGGSKERIYYIEQKSGLKSLRVDRGTRMKGRVYRLPEVDILRVLLRAMDSGFSLEEANKRIESSISGRGVASLIDPSTMASLQSVTLALIRSTFLSRKEFLQKILEGATAVLAAAGWTLWTIEKGHAPRREIEVGGGVGLRAEIISELVGGFANSGNQGPFRFYGRGDALGSDLPGRISLMLVPVEDQKRRRRIIVVLQNRIKPGCGPEDFTFFDTLDASIAWILAERIAFVLNTHDLMDASRRLEQKAMTATSLADYLREICQEATDLLGVERGDVFWPDPRGELRVAAQVGSSALKDGDPLPSPSICAQVFRNRRSRLVRDVRSDPDYCPCAAATECEIAVPLLSSTLVGTDQLLAEGVLNVESSRPGALDENDIPALEHLASRAALAASTIQMREAIYKQMIERSQNPEEPLYAILNSVQRGMGFDGVLIYIADYREARLRCVASLPQRRDTAGFSYRFSDVAFATKILLDGQPQFVRDPWNDPQVSRDGLARFDIHGPMIGVPILFGAVAVGVLVVFGWKSRHPQPDDVGALGQYAKLAVTTIAISDVERQRHDAILMIRSILAQMQNPSEDVYRLLRSVLKGAVSAGFDRARVLRLRENEEGGVFVCLDSYGGDEPRALAGKTIAISQSKYAQKTMSDFREGRLEPRIRVPRREFGEDPYGSDLNKPPGVPWVVAPLVVSGKLFGYIAADKSVTKAEISVADVEYLGLFGTLAAQAIANEQIHRPWYTVWDTLFDAAARRVWQLPEVPSIVTTDETGRTQPLYTVPSLLITGNPESPKYTEIALAVSNMAERGGVLVLRFGFGPPQSDQEWDAIEVTLVTEGLDCVCGIAENRGMHEFEVVAELPPKLRNMGAGTGNGSNLPFRLILRPDYRR